MAAAPTFCSEYSAFVEGVVNGACKFLKNRPVGASFCLPDLPVKDLSDGTGYNFRRMVLLDRLIDRMIFDDIIVQVTKATPRSRDQYRFHANFDPEAGFGNLTDTAWIKAFWNVQEFDQAASDAMTSIERFLDGEAVSQEVSNVTIKTEKMSSQARPPTPVSRVRARSSISDSSNFSETSSPIPLFSSVRGPPSNHSPSSSPELQDRENDLFPQTPSMPKFVGFGGNPGNKEVERIESPSISEMRPADPVQIPISVNRAGAQVEQVTKANIPSFVIQGLAELRKKFPDDIFGEVVDDGGIFHVKCYDCPENLHKVRYITRDLASVECHLKAARHIEKVHDRVCEEGKVLQQTPAVKARVSRLKSNASAVAIYVKVSRTLNDNQASKAIHTPDQPPALNSGAMNYPTRSSSGLDKASPLPSKASMSESVASGNATHDTAKKSLLARVAYDNLDSTSEVEGAPGAQIPSRIAQTYASYLQNFVEGLQKQYPDDQFEVANTQGVLYVKCHDCFGRLLKIYTGAFSIIEAHLRSTKHVENVYDRVLAGEGSIKETSSVQSRVENLKTIASAASIYSRLVNKVGQPPASLSFAKSHDLSFSNIDQRDSSHILVADTSRLTDFESLSLDLACLHKKYPDDSFELSDDDSNPRIKCNDCHERLFENSQASPKIFERHLVGATHILNLHRRMTRQGLAYTITKSVRERMEKMSKQSTTTSLYDNLVKTGAPSTGGVPQPVLSLQSSSISSGSAGPSTVSHTMHQSRSEPQSRTWTLPAKRRASACIADDVASKKVCTGLNDTPAQAASSNQNGAYIAGPAPKEHGDKVQQTMQVLGDIFNTGATQMKALEGMITDSTELIKDLEKENKQQKITIDRLRLDVREQKNTHAEFVKSTEARFERMAQDHKAQFGLLLDWIKNSDNTKVGKEPGASQPASENP